MDVNDVVNQAEQINLYQNPGQSISGLYKGWLTSALPASHFQRQSLWRLGISLSCSIRSLFLMETPLNSIRNTERSLLPSLLRLFCFNSKWLKTGLRRAEKLQP